jgi:hypothetical protein
LIDESTFWVAAGAVVVVVVAVVVDVLVGVLVGVLVDVLVGVLADVLVVPVRLVVFGLLAPLPRDRATISTTAMRITASSTSRSAPPRLELGRRCPPLRGVRR